VKGDSMEPETGGMGAIFWLMLELGFVGLCGFFTTAAGALGGM